MSRFDHLAGEEPDIPDGPPRYQRWSVSELLSADLTYNWDAYGMLVRPTYGMDTGELKTLKSYFAASRAIGLAAGVPILGHWQVPERRRVLMYVAEGGRIPFTRRLVRLAEAHGVDVADLDGWLCPIFDAGPLDSIEFQQTLRNHLSEYQPAFVHLDPLYPFQPVTVDSHRYTQVGLMLNEVQAICAEHDATFWVTAHMNQSGQGFDLKRISGAGIGEWGDSWTLVKHRRPADVDAGQFRLAVEIGSRQWGGGTYDVDFNIGRFDPDSGNHDGAITFNVRSGGGDGEQKVSAVEKEDAERLKARELIIAEMRKARKPLSETDIADRTTGSTKQRIRAEVKAMIAGELLIQRDHYTAKNNHKVPTYVLDEALK